MTAKTRSLIIAFCTLLVISVSGCTIPGPSPSAGSGVVITDFAPEFTTGYYLGEPVNFRVRIQNTGSVDALYVTVELLNLEGWEETGTNDCSFDRLIAPNPDMGTAGESKTCTFKYKAPRELPQGISFTYNPIVRLTYNYQSSTVKSITIASQAELRNIQDTQRALPADTVSSSQGPVSVSIETKGPIRFWQDLGNIIFPIETKVNNMGGGTTSYRGMTNKFLIKTELPAGMSLEDSNCGNTEAELWQGKSYESVCKISATDLSFTAPVQKTITIKADYEYTVEQQTSVTVKWRET